MANSPNLNLETQDIATLPLNYFQKVESDRVENANRDKIDVFAGGMTGSLVLDMFASGNIQTKVSQDIGGHYARTPIVLLEVIAYTRTSGSGGATTIDIQTQEDVGGAFNSIFANAAAMPTISSSAGNYAVAKSSTFKTGSGSLGAGRVLKAKINATNVDATEANSQRDLVVEIFYRPVIS